jgi:hypothetical protein
MSQFNHYAREAEKAAKQAVENMVAVKADFDAAERAASGMPTHQYQNDRVYQAKATIAHDEWQKQMARLASARRDIPDALERDLKAIRRQLEADLTAHFTPSAKQVDNNALEIAKGGILSLDEYGRMIEAAIDEGNHTMARLIGRYAQDALRKEIEVNGNSDATARLRVSIANIDANGPQAWLKAFDAITDMAYRCVRSPGMMAHWDQLFGETIKNF